MEQQPGPVNWAPYNPAPLPGMVRLWTWEAFAHGAEVVSYFRWRQVPFAQEAMHAGLLTPDSRDAPGLDEAARVARELGNRPEVAVHRPAHVGLVFDYESAWAWTTQPQGRDFDYFRLVFEAYRGLRLNGLTVDILPPDTGDLSPYALVVIPGLYAWTEALRAALDRFDGVAVIGPRTGAKTRAMAIPAAMPPDLPALGTRVARVETLRPSGAVPLEGGGHFHIWREITDGASEVVERTSDGEAALRRAGNLRYLCGWPDRAAMRRLLGTAAREAGITTLDLPDGLRRTAPPSSPFRTAPRRPCPSLPPNTRTVSPGCARSSRPASLDAAVLTSMHNVAYYSGFLYCSFGRPYACVVTADRMRARSRPTSTAASRGGAAMATTLTYTDWARDNFWRAVASLTGPGRGIGVEGDHLTLQAREKLDAFLKPAAARTSRRRHGASGW
jgi:hypothetical protein